MSEMAVEARLAARYSPANRFTVVAALLLAAVCLFAGSHLQRGPLRTLRDELQLGFTDDIVENLPANIAFTQAALGSFRGLAVDILWMRAWDMRIAGRYYEMAQLSDWITQLQPRFAEVWEYHSHNLAYNLSESVHSPEEKWEWVRDGIDLLQKKGIPLNPNATKLYQQLAYFYWHRVGKFSTETHWFFKKQHAREWHYVLGAPPHGTNEEVLAWFRPVAEAPADLEGLYKQYPETEAQVALLERLGYQLDLDWVRLSGRLLELLADARELGSVMKSGQPEVQAHKELCELLITPTGAVLLAYARAKALRDEYKMDPKVMQELMEDYGAMDWRHPHAHSAYWAVVGARKTVHRKGVDLYDIVQTDRMVIDSLKGLSERGRINFDPQTGYYNATPDTRVFDGFLKACREAAQRQGDSDKEVPWELEGEHRGWLAWATTALYLYDSRQRAQDYYQRLQNIYSAKWPGLYTKPLDDFVMADLKQGRTIIEQAMVIINGLIYNAFNEGLARGDKGYATRRLEQAKQVYELFKKEQRVYSPDVDQQQKELPPFPRMVVDGFYRYMRQPPGAVPLRLKKRVWDGVKLVFRQFVFDRIKEDLYKETVAAGFDPQKAFPEPPGMKAFRERIRQETEKRKKAKEEEKKP
jgi:hypothetical protein